MHNRIKKLLIEEEKAAKKIEETRRRAERITEIQIESQMKKKLCSASLKRGNELHSEAVNTSAVVSKDAECSPKGVERLIEMKRKKVMDLKKESRKIQKEINLQRFEEFHEKVIIRSKVQRDIEEGHLLLDK